MTYQSNPNNSGAAILADDAFDYVLDGEAFTVPEVDFSNPDFQIPDLSGVVELPERVSIEMLTDKTVDGAGYFDIIMSTLKVHLIEQAKANRITGREFAETYTASTQAALSTAVQLLLGKDQAYYQAVLVQAQAKQAEIEVVKARVELETAKVQYAATLAQMKTQEAEYALTKMRLANEDQQYAIGLEQEKNLKLDSDSKSYILANRMPKEVSLLNEQITGTKWDNDIKEYERVVHLPARKKVVDEQFETQRAQTLDTRSDNSTVLGLIKKQKDLYTQQIESYKRKAEMDVAALFKDVWITSKTVNDAVNTPDELNNNKFDTIVTQVRSNNGL